MRSPHTTTGEQPPLLVTRESLCAGMKIQHRQKQINEQIFKKKKTPWPHLPAWLAYLCTGHEPLATLGNFPFLKRTKLSQGLWAFTSTDSLLGHLCSLSRFSLAAQTSGLTLYTTSFGALGLERLDQILHLCAPTPPCCCHPSFPPARQ